MKVFPCLISFAICLFMITCSSKKDQVKKGPVKLSPSSLNFRELIPDTISSSSVFKLDDFNVWGADMVRTDDDICHLLFSHWPKDLGHHSWVTHSMIGYATSENPEGPYSYKGIALGPREEEVWDNHTAHNPSVIRFKGKYYLYYTGSTGPGWTPDKLYEPHSSDRWQHRMNMRVGVAVADHPSGPWKRFDNPLLDVPHYGDGIVATPCAMVTDNDQVYLYFKTQLPGEGMFGGGVYHYPSVSASPLGPFRKIDKPLVNKNEIFADKYFEFHIDDHEEWFQDDRYYAIVKDHDPPYLTEHGGILYLIESPDGFNWKISNHSFVKDRTILWDNGRLQHFTRLEMPKIYLENGKPRILFLSALAKDDPERHGFNVAVPLLSIE